MFLIKMTKQICDKAILENGGTLKCVPDYQKNKKCVIKQLIITLMRYNLFLNAMRLVCNKYICM